MNNSNESEILQYFEGWDKDLNSKNLSLHSLLEFRKTQDNFTFDKRVEHNLVVKFLTHLIHTAEKELSEAASLVKKELKQASLTWLIQTSGFINIFVKNQAVGIFVDS
jgi:hypothetical protein